MKNWILLDEVTSTNEYLKQHYKQLPNNMVVLAKKQSQGKGRLSRTWKSEEGNLYMSVLRKNFPREMIFQELMNVSVSVVKLLKEYGIQATIKYPNDIIVGTKKIAGILTESIGYDVLEYLIIGIGVNINQFNFQELSDKATSVTIESNRTEDVLPFAVKLYNILQTSKDVYKEYIEHSYVIGKKIEFQGMSYTIATINLDGSLNLHGDKVLNIPLNEVSLKGLYE
jgi:BirA family biotin operon repressor/biotin-[acetyl-CoA-carboxylase] ligase